MKTRKNIKFNDFNSNDGMLTSVWGPSLWHSLHTVSFNYPLNPTKTQQKYHKQLLESLKYTLPCRHCRDNFKSNLNTSDSNIKINTSCNQIIIN